MRVRMRGLKCGARVMRATKNVVRDPHCAVSAFYRTLSRMFISLICFASFFRTSHITAL